MQILCNIASIDENLMNWDKMEFRNVKKYVTYKLMTRYSKRLRAWIIGHFEMGHLVNTKTVV